MKYTKITISGKICTGKTTLLKLLEKKLHWPVFLTGQLFREYVKKENLDLESAEEQNEKITKMIDYKVKDLLHSPGNLIVDGWLSGIMANQLKDVLKVLLICNDEIRYKRFAKREKVNLEEAKKRVEERQKNWFKKIRKIHQISEKRLNNPKNYDLVIDTSYLTPQAILKQVINCLK